jgi:hypothetical protein
MNAFLASAISTRIDGRASHLSVLSWIKDRLEARQRRMRERLAIAHLRKLEPYQRDDAGVDENKLFAAFASIAEAHPAFTTSRPSRH